MSGERWFSKSELLTYSKAAIDNDINGNGRQEVIYRDSLFCINFVEFNPFNEITVEIKASAITANPGQVRFWGPYNIDGQGLSELIFLLDKLYIVSAEDGSLLSSYEDIIGFFDVDGDGLTDLIQFDESSNQTVILGVASDPQLNKPDFGDDSSPKNNVEYELNIEFESEEDFTLGFADLNLINPSDWDLNEDGTADYPLLRFNNQNTVSGFRVIDGASKDILWQVQLPEDEDFRRGFLGFFDIDGANGKEAFFGDGTAIDSEGNIFKFPDNFVISGFLDTDGDTIPEVLGRDTMTNRSLIIGAGILVSTNQNYATPSGIKLHAVFPNPVAHLATFKFELTAPEWITLKIVNPQGATEKVIFSGNLQQGVHQLDWNTEQLTRGLYFYQIITPEGGISKAFVKQ